MASEGVAMNTLQTRRAGTAGAAADGKVVRLTRDRRGKGADSADAEAIYRRILAAIIEHRLAPGRKLVEEREVFETRRLIEPALARKLALSATPAQLARLKELVASEEKARAARDRQRVIKLSGEFHLEMAEMAGNTILARQMRELTLLTCLIISLYDSPSGPACPEGEHRQLLEALARRDSERAAALMLHHLEHVEQSLDMSGAANEDDDLERIFS